MAGDVQGLIADQDFGGLSPADKRTVLGRVTKDSDFNNLSDADTLHFVSRMQDRGRITRPDLYAPPPAAGPKINMQESMLAPSQAAMQPDPKLVGLSALGGEGRYSDPGQAAAATTAGVGAGAALFPQVRAAASGAAKALPYVAGAEAINYARQHLPLGKYIPPGAELLPLFMGGSKSGTAVAEKEAAATSAAEATESAAQGARVPVGKFAKDVPNPNPYEFSGAPKSMDIVQSTNVGKVGYEPSSRTMTVEYKNGNVYSYHGVPNEIYQQAKDAESIGSYISRNVKGRYETVRRGSVLGKR